MKRYGDHSYNLRSKKPDPDAPPSSVVVDYKRGDDSKDEGSRLVVKAKLPRELTSYEKFQAVADQPNGYYSQMQFTYLRQGTIDQWGVTTTDATGTFIEHFTPRKFKNAEGVSFNGKTTTPLGHTDTTVNSLFNLPTMQDTFVKYSHVRYDFVNITQRRCTVQMFICYGTGRDAELPWNDLQEAYDKMQGNGINLAPTTLGVDPMANKEWLDKWKVTKIEFKFEQGEHQSYLLKGPKNYVMDGKTHCGNGTTTFTTPVSWNGPNIEGNGCYVWFRMLNDMCLLGNNDAGTATTTLMGRKIGAHHPINPIPAADGNQQGCVLVKYNEYYHIKAPSANTSAVDARNFLNNFHTIAGATTTETNVDTDQPATIPPNFL